MAYPIYPGFQLVANTYHGDGTDHDVRDAELRAGDLVDEVCHEPDDGDERDELHEPQGREGDAEGAELRGLEAHLEGDTDAEVGDEIELRSFRVGRTRGEARPWTGDESRGGGWGGNGEGWTRCLSRIREKETKKKNVSFGFQYKNVVTQ